MLNFKILPKMLKNIGLKIKNFDAKYIFFHRQSHRITFHQIISSDNF